MSICATPFYSILGINNDMSSYLMFPNYNIGVSISRSAHYDIVACREHSGQIRYAFLVEVQGLEPWPPDPESDVTADYTIPQSTRYVWIQPNSILKNLLCVSFIINLKAKCFSWNGGTRTRNLTVSQPRAFPQNPDAPPGVFWNGCSTNWAAFHLRQMLVTAGISKALYIHSSNMSKNLIPAVSRRYIPRNQQHPIKRCGGVGICSRRSLWRNRICVF